jgi:hypothetical protein
MVGSPQVRRAIMICLVSAINVLGHRAQARGLAAAET